MEPRRILVAVSGGIAAYKVPELVRALVKQGHSVRCALTGPAGRFVSPLVLQTLCGAAVRSDLFDPGEESQIDHIALSDWAELVIVAPATANVLAKMCHGIADDLVTALLLATRAPILVAPAMNVNMWNHPATRGNLAVLRERGVGVVGPESGPLACGWEGEGRMAEPSAILEAALLALCYPSMQGERVLVTAGGTREPIDPVRSITNRSSGKMGFAIAAEAARRGAEVVLVAGPMDRATPAGVRRIDVETALEMRDVVLKELDAVDVVVMAAAVADFRPAQPSGQKIKKESLPGDENLRLDLIRNPDILEEVCRAKPDCLTVGFAAESRDLIAAARRKLERKGCDLIVANDVSRPDAGFDVDTNAVSFVWPGGEVEELPVLSKREVAAQLLDRVEKLRGGGA
ncbi:MAG: bifunctional phosphopantothenoylcysteine decarboxylase/phosphopantothenate--cysteine ligase CoaBC [Myxococcota bacterium]